jgi:crotonobetainyl-CoA:carnitine CoA-transferase CaiB-like acyl-CoA transferase
MSGIFQGVRIIDITKVFSGPFASRMFADYGAEVLKIEHEKRPDDARSYPPLINGWSGYYEILNRNKKGLSLNLSESSDLQKFNNLCKTADVLIENLTPSTKHKLKIDYQTLYKINPRLIYASLSGKGQQNNSKYYDIIAQAESGILSLSGTKKTPMKIGPAVVDAFSGMTLAFAVASALFYRLKTGQGQYIDVSMKAAAMNLLENNLVEYSVTKKNPRRTGNLDSAIGPFGLYKTKDSYIVLAAGNDSLWQHLATFIRKYAAFDESYFKTNSLRIRNKLLLKKVLENTFSQFETTTLLQELNAIGIPCSPVNTMSDVASDSNNYTNKTILKQKMVNGKQIVVPGTSIYFSASPDFKINSAPTIGQNNKEYGV